MASKDHNQFWFPAWGISLVLHGAVVGLAFLFVAQIKSIPQGDTFQWDVALVEEARPDSQSERAQSVEASAQPSVEKLLSSRTEARTESSHPVTPMRQKMVSLPPTIEQAPPVEQKVEAPQLPEEPAEPRDVEATEPLVEPERHEPVIAAAAQESVESQPIEQESVTVASSSNIAAFQEGPVPAEPHTSHMDAASVSMPESQISGSETKADNRWLAESLWRRVAELKRYPNTSRMNGEQGKVILKAVIRSDGQLATVSVQKSSGYSALDEAAMEAVRLACPLRMKQAIGKPQIVVSLPIVYRLAN
ncbi:MAG: TonB family protein [Nitrospira sp.]